MDYEIGDIISGRGIQTGRYEGVELIDSQEYHKVFDLGKKATLFIPTSRLGDLRKLPSKNSVKKHLAIFGQLQLLDEGEVDGSRYKYFKSKLEKVDFKKSFEVLHDLSYLKFTKEISSSERKLLNDLKEKMMGELIYILQTPADELEEIIDFKNMSA